MKKIINWWKRDYNRVTEAWYYKFNGKAPKWVPTVIYILLLPIGLSLFPIVYIWRRVLIIHYNIKLRKSEKILKERKEA